MAKRRRRSKRPTGFTLMEIVLVLALAGLLLVIVFVAVSSAQQARRNFQRKNDLTLFIGMMAQYSSNNKGVPARTQAELDSFQSGSFANSMDPSTGAPYELIAEDFMVPHELKPELGQISYLNGHRCVRPGDPVDTNIADIAPGAPSPFDSTSIVAMIRLEPAIFYCLDSN